MYGGFYASGGLRIRVSTTGSLDVCLNIKETLQYNYPPFNLPTLVLPGFPNTPNVT